MSTEKFQNRFRTASVRAAWHDYNQGSYFITICTQNREHYFGLISEGKMSLSGIGLHTEDCIRNIETLHKGVYVPTFQVMPNHIHMIIIVDRVTVPTPINFVVERQQRQVKDEYMQHVALRCGDLSHLISRFKRAVTWFANKNHIPFAWQSRFHDHIIRNQMEMNRITKYIQNNVVNWCNDRFFD